jgi:hypothetical protein
LKKEGLIPESFMEILSSSWDFYKKPNKPTNPSNPLCFNHSTQRQTLDYLCIQPEEIKGVYQNEL